MAFMPTDAPSELSFSWPALERRYSKLESASSFGVQLHVFDCLALFIVQTFGFYMWFHKMLLIPDTSSFI